MAAVGYIIFYFWIIPAFRGIWSVGPNCLSESPCFYSQNLVCHRTYLCDTFTWEVLLPSLQQTTFEMQICDWNIFCRIFDHCRDLIVVAGGERKYQGIWIVTIWPLVRGSEMVKSTKKHDHLTKIFKILELVSFCRIWPFEYLTTLIWPMTRPLREPLFGRWPVTRPSDWHRMDNIMVILTIQNFVLLYWSTSTRRR